MTPMQLKKAVAGYENLPVFWTPQGGTDSFPVLAAVADSWPQYFRSEKPEFCRVIVREASADKYAIPFSTLYLCCEQAKRLPVYIQDLNGDFAKVTQVNIEKENGWIELIA